MGVSEYYEKQEVSFGQQIYRTTTKRIRQKKLIEPISHLLDKIVLIKFVPRIWL